MFLNGDMRISLNPTGEPSPSKCSQVVKLQVTAVHTDQIARSSASDKTPILRRGRKIEDHAPPSRVDLIGIVHMDDRWLPPSPVKYGGGYGHPCSGRPDGYHFGAEKESDKFKA
jgi:hypothetical protein